MPGTLHLLHDMEQKQKEQIYYRCEIWVILLIYKNFLSIKHLNVKSLTCLW